MESKAAVNLVFLDACRNNPLAENLRRGLEATKRSAALGRGLARIEPTGRDTLIAFAAAPGQEAADGNDRNSPFTASLLRNIPRPKLEVSVMLKEVVGRCAACDRAMHSVRSSSATCRARSISPPSRRPRKRPRRQRKLPRRPRGETIARSTSRSGARRSPPMTANRRASTCSVSRTAPSSTSRGWPSAACVSRAARSRSWSRLRLRPRPSLTPAAPPAIPPFVPPEVVTETPAASAPVVAALPEPAAAPVEAPAAEAGTDLARNIQQELVRLGCQSGDPDGNWGKATRAAIGRFNRYAKASLDPASRRPT